jgi:competence protein ComEC
MVMDDKTRSGQYNLGPSNTDQSDTDRSKPFHAGMFVYASMFLLGVLLVQQLSALPSALTLFVSFFTACLCLAFASYNIQKNYNNIYYTLSLYCISLFLLGFTLSSFYAEQRLALRLDETLVGQNIIVSGKVSSIPVSIDEVQRFEFLVDSFYLPDAEFTSSMDTAKKFPKKIRLSWYYGVGVKAGESWQLQVRLKPPHGFMNPGGFDYEAWLFQHGIDATGYVRKSPLNKRLQAASFSVVQLRAQLSHQLDVVAGRQADQATVQSAEQEIKTNEAMQDKTTPNKTTQSKATQAFALIKALAIGDKSSISSQQWRVLSQTGTSHLMAISGLHIGLASLFAYFLVRRLVPVFIIKRIPAQHIAMLAGLLLAFLYALIAGFSISTQRAMIMLLVLSLMLWMRRNHRPVDVLGFALMLVLLIDPLAVMSAGFWFSFSAVGVIYISLTSASPVIEGAADQQKKRTETGSTELSVRSLFSHIVQLGAGFLRLLKQWVRLQLLISLFLLPLSLFMFQQVSLVSPLANLLLIPYVSFLVVPVVLLAIICSFVFIPAADLLFSLAAWLLQSIWPLLSYLSQLPYAFWVRGDVTVLSLLFVTATMLLLYFSRPVFSNLAQYFASKISCQLAENEQHSPKFASMFTWYFRSLLSLLLLSFVFQAFFAGSGFVGSDFIGTGQRLNEAEFQLTVLDVGQGSAAVLQTKNHVLVFDAGAKFSDRLNAGSGVVIPYLRTKNITQLDRLIISHGDADHIGGAQAIVDEFPQAIVTGQDINKLLTEHKQACTTGLKWQWDGVDFIFLSPEADMLLQSTRGERNNHSCVLKVSSAYGSVLFTGDIEKQTETWLLQNHPQQLISDILVVPHHGSLSSSGSAFIAQVDPEMAVISVGYKNRYRLPNKKVVARYAHLTKPLLQTSKSGAIIISVREDSAYQLEEYRSMAGKYWHHKIENTY